MRHVRTRTGRLVLAGVTAVIVMGVAVTLVMTMVVLPRQRAAEAEAAALAAADAELKAATDAYSVASAGCARASQNLASAISEAQSALGTDPAAMQDPSLIDSLKAAIPTAQAVADCDPPEIAGTSTEIRQQVDAITRDAARVDAATADLSTAVRSVTDSVTAKQRAEAEAKAKAEAEEKARQEKIRKGSVTFTDTDGFSFEFAWEDLKVVAEVDTTAGKPGNAVVSYHLEASGTITNTTPGKQFPGRARVNISPRWADDNDEFCSLFPETGAFGRSVCEDSLALDNRRIGGKRYASPNLLRFSCNTSFPMDVGEIWTCQQLSPRILKDEVAADEAQALVTALESPTVVLVSDETSGGTRSAKLIGADS